MSFILAPFKRPLIDRLAASRRPYRVSLLQPVPETLPLPLSAWGSKMLREKHDGRERLAASLEVLKAVARQDEYHARNLNGRGYSRSDSPAGHRLSKLSTYEVTRNGQLEADVTKLAQRYRKQATSIATPKG